MQFNKLHNHPEKEEENYDSNNGERQNHKSIGGLVAWVVSLGGLALGGLTRELAFGLCELLIVPGSVFVELSSQAGRV